MSLLLLQLLLQHGIWNENDYKVFKCILATCKFMNQYVCQNKTIQKQLLTALLVCKQLYHLKSDKRKLYKQWFELNDIKHGIYQEWYVTGHLCSQTFYVNGNMHGEDKLWFPSGLLWVTRNYVNGIRHGEYKLWFYNGQLGVHGVYFNGHVDRKRYKSWTEDGKPENRDFYVFDI